mmetsp:Transcript_97795/g.183872  ORF Transcript_97795/g.183872 Transcript_97795/m.183872 type:complete len:207 (-) Transcript_97795:3285-3905(-)
MPEWRTSRILVRKEEVDGGPVEHLRTIRMKVLRAYVPSQASCGRISTSRLCLQWVQIPIGEGLCCLSLDSPIFQINRKILLGSPHDLNGQSNASSRPLLHIFRIFVDTSIGVVGAIAAVFVLQRYVRNPRRRLSCRCPRLLKHYIAQVIVQVRCRLGYDPDTDCFRAWRNLVVLSFHAVIYSPGLGHVASRSIQKGQKDSICRIAH